MDKSSKLYCEAMNVEYKNKFLCKLLKYKKVLNNIPDGMDQSPPSYQVLFLARERLNNEIERKKKKYSSFANKILIGVTIGLILLAAKLFIDNFFIPKNPKTIQPQSQQGVRK